jgi:hypothetical protein
MKSTSGKTKRFLPYKKLNKIHALELKLLNSIWKIQSTSRKTLLNIC